MNYIFLVVLILIFLGGKRDERGEGRRTRTTPRFFFPHPNTSLPVKNTIQQSQLPILIIHTPLANNNKRKQGYRKIIRTWWLHFVDL
ncbi:hypothetical protein BDA99DRAFT_495780 [Phascolomyces articulosus]|uniref:Secreted protein n=1 Tax=Phascolomyces articulosus TaxID=60185 RepID=A0AAD5KME4_9FUNG|nr:hypothetical protein BDA99DRAFT_495780 [Phascolomyces articulosus]